MARTDVCLIPNDAKLGLLSDNSCVVVGSMVYEPPIVVVGGCRFYIGNEIGHMTYFSRNCSLLMTSVGRFCSIAEGVFAGPWEHPLDRISTHPFVFNNYGPKDAPSAFEFEVYDYYSKIVDREHVLPEAEMKRTRIGNDVWVGRNVTIRQGVTIGDGAVIAAHAVVNKDVEPYTIVGGVPAKTIRRRFDDTTAEKLHELQWWNYDLRPAKERLRYDDVPAFIEGFLRMKENGEVVPLTVERLVLQVVDNQPVVSKV